MLLDAIDLVLHIYSCYLHEEQIFKSSKWGRLRDAVAGRFGGHLPDVGQTCFLTSTHQHITLTGYFDKIQRTV